jgi:kynurenine formamidase
MMPAQKADVARAAWPMESDAERAIATMADECCNWGRWGPDDQIGTLNFIDPEKIVAAGSLVRKGEVYSLAIPLDRWGPQDPKSAIGAWRSNPQLMIGFEGLKPGERAPHGGGWADDVAVLFLQCGTHWDGLGHGFDRGQMWNGYDEEETSWFGIKRNGIEHWGSKIVTRGVLLDIARHKHVDQLEPSYAITESDLEECIAKQGMTSAVGSGDIVLLRTGQLGRSQADGWGEYAGGDAPGLSFFTAKWLHRSEIAGIASDTWGLEVRPNEFPNADQPLHQIVIPNIGLLIGENFALDALAEACAADSNYEFLFVAPPMPFTGSVSGLINPQAIR